MPILEATTMHPRPVILKNEGSMVQTFWNINVHVVNTDICGDLLECLWSELQEMNFIRIHLVFLWLFLRYVFLQPF